MAITFWNIMFDPISRGTILALPYWLIFFIIWNESSLGVALLALPLMIALGVCALLLIAHTWDVELRGLDELEVPDVASVLSTPIAITSKILPSKQN